MLTVLLGAKLEHTTQDATASRDWRGDEEKDVAGKRGLEHPNRELIGSMSSGVGPAITINMNLE